MRGSLLNRIIVFITLLSLIFLSGLAYLYHDGNRNIQKIIKESVLDKELTLSNILNVSSGTLGSYVQDYCTGNEMAEFMRTRELRWATENLSNSALVNNIDQLIIIDNSFQVIFSNPAKGKLEESFLFLNKDSLKNITANDSLTHFFCFAEQQLYEFYGAPIVPGNGKHNHSKASGWFFAARIWNENYMNKLATQTSSNVYLIGSGDNSIYNSHAIDNIITSIELKDWKGDKIETVMSFSKSPLVMEYKNYHFKLLTTLLIVSILLIILLSWFLLKNLFFPLRSIVKTLKNKDISFLAPLKGLKNEYGEVSSNIKEFIKKEALINDLQVGKPLEPVPDTTEKQFKLIVENLPDVIWIYSNDGLLNFITTNVKALTGYTDRELMNEMSGWFSLIIAEDSTAVSGSFNKFLTFGQPYTIEYRIKTRAGEIKWISEKAIYRYEQNGKIFACGRVMDITENKEIENVLSENDWQFRALFDQNPNGITLLSFPDFRFINANKAFCELLGYDMSELKDLYLEQITHPDDLNNEISHVTAENLIAFESFSMPKRYIRKDGAITWVKLTTSFIKDINGKSILACGFVESIDAKLSAQSAFQKERELLFALMNTIPEQIFFKDNELKYVNANRAFLKFHGIQDVEEIIGKTDIDFFPPALAEKIEIEEKKLFSEGKKIVEMEFSKVNAEGTEQWFFMGKMPVINAEGMNDGSVGVIREITLNKQTESRLIKLADDLRGSNLAKDKFFSIIAHDLKNPFNAILGFSAVLSEEFDDYNDDERKHIIKKLHEASVTTFNLIQNMLEWSRAQSGRIDYSPDMIDISGIVAETLMILKLSADAKNIRFISLINSNTLVYADENMVRFIIRNLFSNSIKFTNSGGRVTISARSVEGKVVEICIADTGVGMTPEQVRKLFKIDELISMPGTNGELGTGLGLVVCDEFIKINKGKIWVESQPGRGSQIYFRLPVANAG